VLQEQIVQTENIITNQIQELGDNLSNQDKNDIFAIQWCDKNLQDIINSLSIIMQQNPDTFSIKEAPHVPVGSYNTNHLQEINPGDGNVEQNLQNGQNKLSSMLQLFLIFLGILGYNKK